jgi:rhodanese-related sulfurtransferase
LKHISKFLVLLLFFSFFAYKINIIKANLVIDGIITPNEYQQKKVFQDGDYELSWRIDGEIVSFAMKAKTTGWVSVGIDPEFKMKNADIYLGWVTKEGTVELFDTFCNVEMGPHPPDKDQGGTNDILAFNGKEDGSYTTIEFSRKLDTGDLTDKIVPKTGKLTVMVAYGATDEFKPRHIFRTTDTIEMEVAKEKFIEITALQAKEMIEKANNIQVLDVSPYWKQGHLPRAINIESNELLQNLHKLDRTKATIVYCHGDAPAIFAANILVNNGFKPVFRLLGNYKAWVDAGFPIEKDTEKIIIRFKVGSKTYFIGAITKEMDSPPVIIDGRALIPIRYLAEAIGAKTEWEPTTRKITLRLNLIIIELVIDQNMAMINGKSKQIDPSNPKVKPIIILGRTMLPLRFVAEQLNCLIDWNPSNQEIVITYPK